VAASEAEAGRCIHGRPTLLRVQPRTVPVLPTTGHRDKAGALSDEALALERGLVASVIARPDRCAEVFPLLSFEEPRRVLAAAARCSAERLVDVPLQALVQSLAALDELRFVGGPSNVVNYILEPEDFDFASALARLRDLHAGRATSTDEVETYREARAATGHSRRQTQGAALELDEDEPAEAPVNGAELLHDLCTNVRRFVVLPEHAAVTTTLWITLTYFVDAVSMLPRLLLSSPTKSCGKTRLLTVLGALVYRPLAASSISPSAVFRAIEAARPTLLLDEMDNARLNESPELRAVLNSGHTRGAAFTVRTVGDRHEVRRFSTWAPVAFACIGRLPDTVASRCVRVEMQRRRRDDPVEALREHRLRTELEPLRRGLVRWSRDHSATLRDFEPDLPSGLADRDADNWTPLLAIADLAGGSWPGEARRAVLAACGAASEDGGAREMLLADLCDLFTEQGTDRLTSAEVLTALTAREDRPWSDWAHGKPLTPRGLATLLDGFNVEPRNLKTSDGKVRKGYHRDQFGEAWGRYLPVASGSDPRLRFESQPVRAEEDFETATEERAVAVDHPLPRPSIAGGSAVAAGSDPVR